MSVEVVVREGGTWILRQDGERPAARVEAFEHSVVFFTYVSTGPPKIGACDFLSPDEAEAIGRTLVEAALVARAYRASAAGYRPSVTESQAATAPIPVISTVAQVAQAICRLVFNWRLARSSASR